MRFDLTSEQRLSRDALRELLRQHCPAAELRRVFEGAQPCISGLWQKLVELGVIGALAPEAAGGVGLDFRDLVVLLEETGRAAVPEPVVETAAVAVPLLAALAGSEPRARAWLARVLAGTAKVAVGLRAEERAAAGAASVVASGVENASVFLLGCADGLYLLEPAEIRATALRSVDRARSLAQIDFDRGACEPLAGGARGRQLIAAGRERAALGAAAQLVGLGARMLDLTIAHVQTREQFGRPIGSYQAVKHQLVDAYLAVEYAEPLVYRAAHSIAREDPEQSLHVSIAKAFASDAGQLAARKALQLHGAIGYAYEYDLQLYLKRTWALAAAYGDGAEHRRRIAGVMFAIEGEHHA